MLQKRPARKAVSWRASLLWSLAAGAATGCSGGTNPTIGPCTAASDSVRLTVGQYVSLDPASVGACSLYPAAASTAEYLLVPQLATGVPGQTSSFRLLGDTIRPAAAAVARSTLMGSAERFHRFLRLGDERRSWGFAPESLPALHPPRAATAAPPGVGTLRTFMVCAKIDCSRFDAVAARVKTLKNKIAIYVDTLAPAGGLDSVALDSIASVFAQRLYGVDTAAFGRESDIDSNTVVLVLMTNTVNKLVTTADCNASGFVAGFFFGADLDPAFRTDPRSNKGEIFYSVVPDPNATLSCAHTVAEVEAFLPVTFIHEFQHMISFNHHVLENHSTGEVLWLNEGMSHYAEELGGRSYESSPDGQLTDCVIGTTTCRFYVGDLLNAYSYLDSTGQHFLEPTAGIGSLAERGAAWLFVRFVVDRYSAGGTLAQWNALTQAIDETGNTGAQNIATVTGTPFATVASHWALANWVSDLPGFTAPPELRYGSWGLRSVFASLHNQRGTIFPNPYPLIPTSSAGPAVNVSGTLRAGSVLYHRALQQTGDPGFTLSFTTSSGTALNSALVPRLNVIRIQ